MKKTILFIPLLLIFACDDDKSIEEFVPEKPEQVLKLKTESDNYISNYYYNDLGFVDSIARISDYGGNAENYFNKFTYENGEVTTVKSHIQSAHENNAPIQNYLVEQYEYINGKISKKTIYDANNVVIATNVFTYNDVDNTMLVSFSDENNYTIKYYWQNNNILKSELNHPEQQSIANYKYDNKYNPKYYIYPKAYILANAISKNNVKYDNWQGNNYSQTSNYIINYNKNYFPVFYADSRIHEEGMVGLSSTSYSYY